MITDKIITNRVYASPNWKAVQVVLAVQSFALRNFVSSVEEIRICFYSVVETIRLVISIFGHSVVVREHDPQLQYFRNSDSYFEDVVTLRVNWL
jgi:hypothetical protein